MLPIILADAAAGGFYFPPLHPIFVNFTAALIPTSFLFDLLGLMRKNEKFRAVGWWTLLLAGCLSPLTVAFGWLWKFSMSDMDHWQMRYHQWLGSGLLVALIVMVIWRGIIQRRNQFPGALYGLVAFVALIALLAQGDLGGSMSFDKGILFTDEGTVFSSGGETEHEHDHEPATHAHGGSTHPSTSMPSHGENAQP